MLKIKIKNLLFILFIKYDPKIHLIGRVLELPMKKRST